MRLSFPKNALVAALSLTGLVQAQNDDAGTGPRPMFTVLHPKPNANLVQPAVKLPTWKGSYTYSGQKYSYTMVGTAPATGTSTTVPAYIIPIKIVIQTKTFDPSHVLTNGNTVIQNTVLSPIFDTTTTYTQEGVNVGTTQYIDAYQRANFWGKVKSHPNYHLLLGGPTVLAEQTLTPPAGQSSTGTYFGVAAGVVNINWFDAQVQPLLKTLNIPADALPIFLIYDVYLSNTSGASGCCIGGYHSYTGVQAYADFTYADVVGAFAQNVSALSHEVGEWADDPETNNTDVPALCGEQGNDSRILEVGDPLEGNPNYGGYAYSLHGFTYDLQDLVTLPYFGAPPTTSVKKQFTFQGETLSVCQNGG
ncbi:MAG: hypothetical protein ACLP59_19265 [Bryobacteraceae bacterium]